MWSAVPAVRRFSTSCPRLRARYKLDFVVVNGENAAGGFGITEAILRGAARCRRRCGHARQSRLRPEGSAGVHRAPADGCSGPSTIRRARPAGAPASSRRANGADVLVINAMGLIFMPELADPFRAVDAEIDACGLKQGADAILIDFHAEATSEKQAMGYFVDGRASCVVGTHTHAPTADERVLPRRHGLHVRHRHVRRLRIRCSAWTTDEPLNRFLTKIPRGRIRAGHGPGDSLGAGGGDRRRDRPCHAHDSIAARWCFGTYRAAVLGRVRKRVSVRKTANSVLRLLRADTRGSRDCRPWAAGRQSQDASHPEADARPGSVNERLMRRKPFYVVFTTCSV